MYCTDCTNVNKCMYTNIHTHTSTSTHTNTSTVHTYTTTHTIVCTHMQNTYVHAHISNLLHTTWLGSLAYHVHSHCMKQLTCGNLESHDGKYVHNIHMYIISMYIYMYVMGENTSTVGCSVLHTYIQMYVCMYDRTSNHTQHIEDLGYLGLTVT